VTAPALGGETRQGRAALSACGVAFAQRAKTCFSAMVPVNGSAGSNVQTEEAPRRCYTTGARSELVGVQT